MMVANMGLPVGAELIVPAAGALVATAGELAGGTVLYAVGYVGGRPFVTRYGRFLKVDEKKLDQFDTFYHRHGSIIVLVCRFLPFVRGFSALPAGVSKMPKRYFLAYTAAGSAVFCFGLAYLGSAFGQHFDEIAPQIHKATTAFVLAARIAHARRKASQTP